MANTARVRTQFESLVALAKSEMAKTPPPTIDADSTGRIDFSAFNPDDPVWIERALLEQQRPSPDDTLRQAFFRTSSVGLVDEEEPPVARPRRPKLVPVVAGVACACALLCVVAAVSVVLRAQRPTPASARAAAPTLIMAKVEAPPAVTAPAPPALPPPPTSTTLAAPKPAPRPTVVAKPAAPARVAAPARRPEPAKQAAKPVAPAPPVDPLEAAIRAAVKKR
jgi:hypothetical protein